MAFWKDESMIEKKDPGRDPCEDDSPVEEIEEELEEEEDDSLNVNEEEIKSLNMQLDQLNNALDRLEQKNDNLHAQLIVLLEANKQAREHFLQIRNQNCDANNKNDNS